MEFIQHFKAARRVSTPLVAIRTFDAKSTIGAIRASLGERLAQTAIILWDAVNGMQHLTEEGEKQLGHILNKADAAQEGTVPLAETLRIAAHCTENVILFISNAHLQWKGEAAVIQGIWNLRDAYKAQGNMLVLLCNPGAVLPAELTSDILMLDEPLPTAAELQAIVNATYKSARVAPVTDDVMAQATDALIGLPAFPADQATAMCLTYNTKDKSPERVGSLDVHELWDRKRSIIGQTPGLTVWQGKERLEDIGGIEQAKLFCRSVMEGNDPPKVIIFIDEIEKALAGTGTDMSGVKTELVGSMLTWMQDTEMDGCIFTGIPGVSKSNLAKALGGSYGKPVVNFDLAGMQSGIVGSSGANLRAAQATVNAISGGRVLALATCNSMSALPPEMLRRFALGIFYFDAPSPEERAAIWNIYRTKYGIDPKQKTPASDGWTGAEIKECCKKAYRMNKTLAEAAQFVVPVTQSSAQMVKLSRQSADGKYLSASKPGVYRWSEASNALPTMPVYETTGRMMRDN